MFEDDAEEVFKRTPIWFKDDGWDELADIIGDYDEGFMIWYFVEGMNAIPDIGAIKKRCPVDWNEQDTQESLDDKISRYMLKKMLEK